MSALGDDEVHSEPDRRCLRGLATRVTFPARLDLGLVEAGLVELLGPCVVATEQWALRRVTRLVRQFVVEVRLGESDGELTMHHRLRVAPPQRVELDAKVVQLMRRLVAAELKCEGRDATV